MKIAPIDIAHKTFGRKFNGIDSDEVQSFLREVAEEMETVIRERNQLKEQAREKELQLMEYKERDKALKETLMTAHKMTEQFRRDAEREAGLIINDANQKAEGIVRDARDSLKKTYQEISDLKRLKAQFEVGVKQLVAAHLELIERSRGYLPHINNPNEANQGGSSPGMRQGKPILET